MLYIIRKLFFFNFDACYKIKLFAKNFAQFTFKSNGALSTIPLKFSVNFEEFLASHISFEDFLCATVPCATLSNIITSKYMFGQFFSIFGCTFPLKELCLTAGAFFIFYMCLWISDVSKEMWDTENFNKYYSKLTENFKGIVLKTPLILNVNCAKILAKSLIL